MSRNPDFMPRRSPILVNIGAVHTRSILAAQFGFDGLDALIVGNNRATIIS